MAIFVLIHVHTWIIDWIGHFENMFGKMEILLVYHLKYVGKGAMLLKTTTE